MKTSYEDRQKEKKFMKRYYKKGSYKKYNYEKEIKEWQENQYNPGHYLGGKIPSYYDKPGHPLLLAWSLIIPGVVWVAVYVLFALQVYKTATLGPALIISFFLLGFPLLSIIAGVRLLKKYHVKLKQIISVKKILVTIGIVSIVTIGLVLFYNSKTHVETIMLTSNDFGEAFGNDSYFITIKVNNIERKISCSESDFDKFDILSKKRFIVKYKWNEIFYTEGKLIELKIDEDTDSNKESIYKIQ